jgi:uncharacterized membrane protein YfcA
VTPLDSICWLFAIGLLTTALGTVSGMTSGVLIVPFLTAFAHLDIHTAIGVSWVSVIACSCGGAGPFLKARLTNVRLAIVLETATTLGGACGLLFARWLSSRALFLVFALALLVSAQRMFAGPHQWQKEPGNAGRVAIDSPNAGYTDVTRHSEVGYRVEHLPVGLCLMYAASLLSSLAGISSGVLNVPAMDTSLRLPIKVSIATSSFMIGVAATAGAGNYFLRGNIQPMIVAPVALGSVLGTALGARRLPYISDRRLRVVFVMVLLILALQMLLISLGVSAGMPL